MVRMATVTAISLAGLLLPSPSPAFACEAFALDAASASIDVCDTPWVPAAQSAGEHVFICEGEACGQTVLRVELGEMLPEDMTMAADELLNDWTRRNVPETMGGFQISMIEPISRVSTGRHEGILIPLELTGSDGASFRSVAFRIPREGQYLILNATGTAEFGPLREMLLAAVEAVSFNKEPAR
jgi:hypothetical protein